MSLWPARAATAIDEFDWFREHYDENVERMFAAVGDLYAEYWSDFFHFAIFEKEGEDRDAAFLRTHRRYAVALNIRPANKVLELTCGRGGFSDFLAGATGADVLGIDISRAQLDRAARYKRPNLRFKHHDIMKVEELGEIFDAVVFMDADCYLPDKAAAVTGIGAVMRPGARFLLIAWCRQSGLRRVQEELVLAPFMRYWGVPDLETPSGYRRHFKRAGLRILEEVDLNEAVRPNWEFGYARAIEAIREISVAKAARMLWRQFPLGAAGIRLIKEQFPAALYIKAGFDAGFLRYTYFLAEKG